MTHSSSFPEAGDSEDLHAEFLVRQWSTRREAGLEGLARARSLLELGDRKQAEVQARESFVALRSALNWAEFGPNEDQAHRELDDAGAWVRRTFGCTLARAGTEYEQACPVALAHNRIGLSVGGAAVRVCSLCGEDLSECPHMRDRAYLVPGGVGELGWCRVCVKHESCGHSGDQTYRAYVIAVITQMELEEVSFVSRPAHPDARLGSVSISHEDLREALGPDFHPGIEVSCDRCLKPCSGLVRPSIPHG